MAWQGSVLRKIYLEGSMGQSGLRCSICTPKQRPLCGGVNEFLHHSRLISESAREGYYPYKLFNDDLLRVKRAAKLSTVIGRQGTECPYLTKENVTLESEKYTAEFLYIECLNIA